MGAGVTLIAEPAFALQTGIANPTKQENSLPGTSDWWITAARNNEVAGYASATSVNRGEPITLHIHCIDPRVKLEVFRLGWYQGMGARLMLPNVTVTTRSQPMPTPNASTGLAECNWAASYTVNTQTNSEAWPSGYYLARLTSQPRGYQSYIIFLVRDDQRKADLLFQQSVTTYAAYNLWGGKNLYGGTGGQRAYKVSFNRPYDDSGGAGHVWAEEMQMLRFLEREGYDVKYCTNIDVHLQPAATWGAKAFLSVGHDEYWSWEMRQHVEEARASGLHLAFFSSNTCYRQIRLEPSPLTGAANRTVVCYKDNLIDPVAKQTATKHLTTVSWRDEPVNRPECELIGIQYDEAMFPAAGNVVVANDTHWVFQDTGLRNGDRFINLLNGREVDRIYTKVPNTEILCASPVQVQGLSYDANRLTHVTLYTWPSSGALVFASGTMYWSLVLDDFGQSARGEVPVNLAAQQMTRNLLARFTSGNPLPPPPGPSSTILVKIDRETQGTWRDVYGTEGYFLCDQEASIPDYAEVSIKDPALLLWEDPTTDSRALQRVQNDTRFAWAWAAEQGFVLDINLTDEQEHLISVYCLDWENVGLEQTITITDALENTVLDTQEVRDANGGQYLVWRLKGHVQLTVTPAQGEALVSGVFFDPVT
ncbi:MAG: DUF6605 domain-containing protein [Blastocatellia bacterium]